MTTKKHATTLLVLMLVGLMELANAQMSAGIKAQVPFEFVANGKTMPAGECIITVVGQKVLSITNEKQFTTVRSIANESRDESKQTALVFHRYGDRYFLAGIKRAGEIGYQLPASKRERELQARNIRCRAFTLLASAK